MAAILKFPSELTRMHDDEIAALKAALASAEAENRDLKMRMRAMEVVYAAAVNPSAASPFAHLAAVRR